MNIDLELITMILIVIGGFILLRIIYKLFARHRVLKVLVIGIFCLVVITMVFFYVKNNQDIYDNNRAFYVYGKVKQVKSSIGEFEIESVRTTLTNGGKGRVTVKLNSRLKVVEETKGKEEKNITVKDIRYNDTILVYCKESRTDEKNEVTATKIIRKID